MRTAAPVPVLGFHHISDEIDDYTSLREETYAELIEALAARYRLTTVSGALTVAPGDDRPALALTFDDAYADILAPALAAASLHSAVGTVYVITGHVGGPNAWNRKCADWSRHMDRTDLDELRRAGFEVGSHTSGHYRLTKLPTELLAAELRDSRAWLEDAFGVPVPTLAYPFGFHDERVRAAAAEYYDLALTTTTKPGGTDPDRHRFALRRFMVTRSMTVADVLAGIEEIWGSHEQS